jgi:hypothetical protein
METLSQPEFLAALFSAAVAGIAMLVTINRSSAFLSDEMAQRVAQSIATLNEGPAPSH